MANIPNSPTWSPDVYQIASTDAVLGGPDGVINVQAKQLADRTAYLKQEVEAAGDVADGADTKADSALAQIADIEAAAGSAQANAAAALLHKQGAQAAQALAEQARNAAQAAQAQAWDNAGFSYQASQTAQMKAQEAQAAATAAVSAASMAVAAKDDALTAAADSAAEAALAQNAAVSSGLSRDAAAASASASQASRVAAESARDAATVNAVVYDSTTAAQGDADVAIGAQYQVVIGSEIVRYRKNSMSSSTEVARYPAASAVKANTLTLKNAVRRSLNLFDKDDADYLVGQVVSHVGGGLLANASYDTSGFIPVVSGSSYYISPKSFLHWYNASRIALGVGSSNTDTNNVQTAPASAAFLRISLHKSIGDNPNTAYVIAGSSPLETYEPFGGVVDVKNLKNIPPSAILDGSITPVKTSFLQPTKNLFSEGAITSGFFMGASGTPVASASYVISDFIPVVPGQQYVCNRDCRFLTAFNRFGVVISAAGSNETLPAGTPFTVSSGVYFMRVTVAVVLVAGIQFEQSSTMTPYVRFGFSPSSMIILDGAASGSLWAGKNIAFMGDSLTAQAQFITPAAAAISLLTSNYGIGGTKLAMSNDQSMWQDARINAIPTNVDAVHVMGGTNDWANNGQLGAPTSTNTNEVYGALNVMAEKLAARFPKKPVFFGTAPMSSMTLPRAGFTDPFTNGQGLTMLDYADAGRAVARRWGFPVIDYAVDAGFNRVNLASYMVADGNFIHPNTAGGKRMAAVLIGRLRDLEPIA